MKKVKDLQVLSHQYDKVKSKHLHFCLIKYAINPTSILKQFDYTLVKEIVKLNIHVKFGKQRIIYLKRKYDKTRKKN